MTQDDHPSAACCSPVTEAPLSPEQSEDLAHLFRAIADPVRLRLISLIASHPDGRVCVCDLTAAFDLTGPTISHHLKVLRTAGLIEGERRGTWSRPYVPYYPGQDLFAGRELHTMSYQDPDEFAGQRVIVVGGGNSAAQILAEISTVTDTRLVSLRQPRLLPDDVDGRVLFDVATRHYLDRQAGRESDGVAGLGDIVTVPPVRAAGDRGVLRAEPMFARLLQSGVGGRPDREGRHHHLVHRIPARARASGAAGPRASRRPCRHRRHPGP